MKRHIDRDISPRNKRSRNMGSPDMDIYQRYNNRVDMEYERHGRMDMRRSPSSKERFEPNHGYYPADTRAMHHQDYQNEAYRSLCLSNLHPKVDNKTIEEQLKKEFRKFGDFNVKFAIYNGERVAYMNYRYPQHAREARYGIPKLYMFERQVRIQPMYGHSRRRSPSPPIYDRGGGSMRGDIPPGYDMEDFRSRGGSPGHSQDGEYSRGRKDAKFPYHLDHLDPEDDVMATRTLFVGNLAPDITEEEIQDVFEKYGYLEDIDIKRPTKGSGNAYSFIRYVNLDMAHRAKVDMSGRYVKSFQCKIGYGKVTPTKCVWVGGLGPWIQYDVLEREFERFGAIEKIEWPPGKNYAYILYENIESAVRSCSKMRGFPLGGPDKRIRVDFGDMEHINNDPLVRRKPQNFDRSGGDNYRNSKSSHDRGRNSSGRQEISRAKSNSVVSDVSNPRGSTTRRSTAPSEPITIETAITVAELSTCLNTTWNGLFFLKNSNFGCRIHILHGEDSLVDQFMKRGEKSDLTLLRITQRMKLDPIKLDDVSQRIQAAGNNGFCVMLALPATVSTPPEENGSPQQPQRPLKNLITYLRSKESAGVVFLKSNEGDAFTGVLHAFPPCEFGMNLLTQQATHLNRETHKDDYLVVLLIKSSPV